MVTFMRACDKQNRTVEMVAVVSRVGLERVCPCFGVMRNCDEPRPPVG